MPYETTLNILFSIKARILHIFSWAYSATDTDKHIQHFQPVILTIEYS